MFQHLWMMFPIGLIGLIVSTIMIAFHDMCSSINPPISDCYEEDTKPNQTVFVIFLISSTMSLLGCCFYY
jgi:hypothetical protein